jgi:major membrane immunogen (membrane-anchored lipoprotein)
MKLHYSHRFNNPIYSLALILALLANACSMKQEDDLNTIKAFKPDDEYFKSSLVTLHFVTETSPVGKVDTLFRQLIEVYGLPTNSSGIQDGTYTGSSPYDAFDYKHVVEIRIEEGKIVEVDYNEVKWDGKGKQEDMEYCEEMSASGTTPAIAYPAMEKQLLAAQDIMKVDAVSGATYSLYRFRYAVTVALMKALI